MTEESIRSKAIVQYEPFILPTTFNRLAPHTDLHQPPENWLKDDTASKIPHASGQHSASSSQSSLHIANRYLDMVGDVDVIASAEVVKKLMRMPLDKRQVSVVVHRVGNTLLFDEFDVLAMLMAAEEREWEWIKEFVRDHLASDLKNKNLNLRRPYHKSTPAALERNMLSKFLHYSVPTLADSVSDESQISALNQNPDLQQLPDPPSEEPSIEHPSRTVLWQFEDMQMLLGSTLPIFGGANHPVVSLRLHDATKPINVLTGLDYWLDNLICNVPELAMCYHINGIVQNYEILKTIDIPDLPDSRFSPTVIRDVAQNILSFLNNKCTKEGHTYWLFKAQNDEIVKLYDLTSICDQRSDDSRNPFSLPVAFLLYRVAKNLLGKFKDDEVPPGKVRATVYSLLRNCLKLIEDHSNGCYPDLEACIYFLLVQLFVPASCNQWSDWLAAEDDASSVYSDDAPSLPDDEDLEDDDVSEAPYRGVQMDVKNFVNGKMIKECRKAHDYMHVTLTVEQRCRSALEYVSRCIKYLSITPPTRTAAEGDEEEGATSAETPSNVVAMTTTSAWRSNVETSLGHKVAVILFTLARHYFDQGKYGRSFRYVKFAILAYGSISNVKQASDNECVSVSEESRILGCEMLQLLGDVFVMVALHVAKIQIYQEESAVLVDCEADLLEFLSPASSHPIYEKVDQLCLCGDPLKSFENSLKVYLLCKEVLPSTGGDTGEIPVSTSQGLQLVKRLGNVNNELGKIFENQLMEQSSLDVSVEGLGDVMRRSNQYFDEAILCFQRIADRLNVALVLSNLGRLMRIWAHILSCAHNNQLTQQEKNVYYKAIDYYKQALSLLDTVDSKELYENVNWDLSSTYLTLGKQVQDATPAAALSRQDAEHEVIELLSKSMKHCTVPSKAKKGSQAEHRYSLRLGEINQRLGSLYHQCYREDEQKTKSLNSMAEFHYSRAVDFYRSRDSLALIRVQIERVALIECHCTTLSSNVKIQQRLLRNALDILCDTVNHFTAESFGASSFQTIFTSQFLKLLLTVYKHASSIKNKEKLANELKTVYASALKNGEDFNKWVNSCKSTKELLTKF